MQLGSGKSDAELLAAYTAGVRGASAAESAFAEIVARHGGMVHHTCLRILGDHALAEDASQAVFVVLARKADSVRGDLGAFLHGVAVNVARRSREAERLRAEREREAAMASARPVTEGEAARTACWDSIRPALDEAVERLPRMQRAAVVLHLFEGMTQEESAGRLGISRSALDAHVRRATEKLRARLAGKAGGLSVAALGPVILAGVGADTACPAYLVAGAGKIAVAGPGGAIGVGAGVGAIGANVAVLAKGALNTMFWAKVKMVAMVAVAATAAATAVPVTVAMVKAGEEAKKPEPVAAAPTPAEPAKEEALDFRQVFAGISFTSKEARHLVIRSKDEFLAAFRGHMWPKLPPGEAAEMSEDWEEKNAELAQFNFTKEMVLAAFKGRITHTGYSVQISRIRVVDNMVKVEYEFKGPPQGFPDGKGVTYPYDLVACPRRDLPVVFFENGKEVARVPFAAMDDMDGVEFPDFLKQTANAWNAGIGIVAEESRIEKVSGYNAPNGAALTRRLPIPVEKLKVRWEAVLFGPRLQRGQTQEVWSYLPAGQQTARFAKDDKVIFIEPSGGMAIMWSPEREKAVRFALAPGWRSGVCPWCADKGGRAAIGNCSVCKGQTESTSYEFCLQCALERGACRLKDCPRKVGPATQGVKLRLTAHDPAELAKRSEEGWTTGKMKLGESLRVWLQVDNKAPDGSVPEIQTPGGGGRLDCCQTLFFLVEGPGTEGPTPVGHVDGGARARMEAPRALEGQATSGLTLLANDMAGRPVFAKPGDYTVRAAAGRLISNPVTVVVEGPGAAMPEESAWGEPVNGLRVGVRMNKAAYAPGEGISAEALLKNESGKPMTIRHYSDTMGWSAIDARGQVVWQGQAWKMDGGNYGEGVEIAAQGEVTLKLIDPPGTRHPILEGFKAGTYRLRFDYTMTRESFGANREADARMIDDQWQKMNAQGVWTGTVRSGEVRFSVLPGAGPVREVPAPERVQEVF